MYLAVIILPLLGSIVSGFFGRKVGVSGAQIVTSGSVILTTILAVLVFFEVAFNNVAVSIFLCRWLELGSLNVLWAFNFDFLTVSMLIPVLIISSLVHIYSIGYMSSDPHNQRFFSYLSLFTFMMVILVTSNNFLLMFVGWEGVGICSYLLVNFWFTRIAANQSSISALLTNRVGDCFLTIGMFIMLLSFGNIDYTTVFSIAPFISQNNLTIIGACLLIGAMAKSSQVGLHVWLPLAMEGPTPVSALIHAATMVTAGVYLLMRASPILEYTSSILLACLWIGSVTTVFSSVVGLFQQDIKKVIAYSTMSQLGMMVIAIGLSCYNLALFHLVNHAFYKGLLFLAAGSVIHAVADNQDFRKYGGLILFLPLTYTVMLIASLSLIAIPFMTGFYSKDFILESCFSLFNYPSIAVYFTAVIGAVFTTLYSAKILYLTFIASPNASSITYNRAHESDVFMSIPLVVLALFSIYFGFISKDLFIGIGTHAFIDNSIFIHPTHELSISSEFAVPLFFKLLPFFLTITFLTGSVVIFETMPKLIVIVKYTRFVYNIFAFLNLKFLIECLYNRFITYFILKVGGQTTKVLDKGLVEKIGPYGLETFFKFLSRNLNTLNTKVVTTYALYILIGFMIYVSLPYLLANSSALILTMFCSVSFMLLRSKLDKSYINGKRNTDFLLVSSSFDYVTAMNCIAYAAGATLICAGFAVARRTYNSLTNTPQIEINIQAESKTEVISVESNSTSIEGYLGKCNFIIEDALIKFSHGGKWVICKTCDVGDLFIDHPWCTFGFFTVLGIAYCTLYYYNLTEYHEKLSRSCHEPNAPGYFDEINKKHGIRDADVSHCRDIVTEASGIIDVNGQLSDVHGQHTATVFDQHIHSIMDVFGCKISAHIMSYKALLNDVAERYEILLRNGHNVPPLDEWPAPLDDHLFVSNVVSYLCENFRWLRSWSNTYYTRPDHNQYVMLDGHGEYLSASERALECANFLRDFIVDYSHILPFI